MRPSLSVVTCFDFLPDNVDHGMFIWLVHSPRLIYVVADEGPVPDQSYGALSAIPFKQGPEILHIRHVREMAFFCHKLSMHSEAMLLSLIHI